jgi:hypothetical protein
MLSIAIIPAVSGLGESIAEVLSQFIHAPCLSGVPRAGGLNRRPRTYRFVSPIDAIVTFARGGYEATTTAAYRFVSPFDAIVTSVRRVREFDQVVRLVDTLLCPSAHPPEMRPVRS